MHEFIQRININMQKRQYIKYYKYLSSQILKYSLINNTIHKFKFSIFLPSFWRAFEVR